MKKTKVDRENIFITWHYTTHGIAYLKHILSAYYSGRVSVEKINLQGISQAEMNEVFDTLNRGFLFDKVYYLTCPQQTFDDISTRRFNYRDNILVKDELINETGTLYIWEDVKNQNLPDLQNEIKYVQGNYSEAEFEKWFNQIWRDIQHYSISDQLLWLLKYSNIHKNYQLPDIFTEKKIDIKNLRNSEEISGKLKPLIDELIEKHPNADFIINVSLGSNETQVVWQVFSELGYLPGNTKLLSTYDSKSSNQGLRFKDFTISELPSKIVTVISNNFRIFDKKPLSEKLILAELKMETYLKEGFSILLIGERGIGKTRLAQQNNDAANFFEANCASFPDDTLAESELFGHVKGAFTGADTEKKGLFEMAENGFLFLDEIHHLSHRVQAKLMKSIETDQDNFFQFRKLGSSNPIKLKTTLIFGTNQTIVELRKSLLPDFYDRITQLIIELPPLRDTPEDIPVFFKSIWNQMKFEVSFPYNKFVKQDSDLVSWLKTLRLSGNFRDLQKIAICYKLFLNFDSKIKKMIKEKTAYEYAKNEYEKYISVNKEMSDLKDFFSEAKTVKEMEKDFKKQLAEWAISKFDGAPKAESHFKKLGDKTTKETLYKWKNTTEN